MKPEQQLTTKPAEIINANPEQDTTPFNLASYAKEYGIDIKKQFLSPTDVVVLYLARKLEPVVQDLKIPVSVEEKPSDKKQLVEKDVEKTVEKVTYTEGERDSVVPADKMDIVTISDAKDLPKILTSQWLLEGIVPELFYDRLANRQLMMPKWQESFTERDVSYETVVEKELVEVAAPPTKINRQHAYALIDVSGSMGTSGDGRDVLAKGLTLAFLKSGFSQGSLLALRPFSGQPHELMEGKTESEFRSIVQRVINLSMDQGGTFIQGALEQAVTDIRRQGKYSRADILLISDGYDQLGHNPLGTVNLHTFIMGQEGYNAALDHWSKSLRVLSVGNLPEIKPTPQEIKYLRDEATQLRHKLTQLTDHDQASELAHELNAMLQFGETLRQFSSMRRSRSNDTLNEAIEELSQLRGEIAMRGLDRIIAEQRARSEQEAARRKAVEEAYARAEAMKVVQSMEQLNRQLAEFARYQQTMGAGGEEYEEFKEEVRHQQKSSSQQMASRQMSRSQTSQPDDVDLFKELKRLVRKGWRYLRGKGVSSDV